MTKLRIWMLGSAIVALLVVAGGWFLGISPLLTAASAGKTETENVEATNAVQAAALAKLKQQYTGIDALKVDLAELRESVPADADIAGFLRELSAIATASGVTVETFTASDALPYAAPAPEVVEEAPAADATIPEGATATGETAETAPVAATTSAAGVPAAPVALDAANFISIPLGISVTGDSAQSLEFVSRLQSSERLYLLTDLSIATDDAGVVTTELTGYIYVMLSGASGAASPADGDIAAAGTVDF